MRKMKKVLALLMATVLFLVMLSGCGSGNAKMSDAESQTKESTSNGEEAKSDLYGADFTGYPIRAENATLRIWTTGLGYHKDYASEAESPYHQYLSEFTGVKLIWERPAAGEDGEQAYNLLLASGDLPDIIYIGGLPRRAEILINEGYIITLDDYMPKYAPALYTYLMKNPDRMKAVKTDNGNLYTFPFLREDVVWQGSYVGNMINVDYLNQIGRDMPVTLDEWKDTFYALKDVCDIVFATNAAIRLKYFFANAYGIGVDNYYVDDKEVKASFTGDKYYEFLKTMNQFYKDGLIDPDFATADTTGFTSLFVASKVGVACTGTVTPGYFYDQIVERDGKWNYEPIPYPVAKKGDPIKYIQGEALWTGTGAIITTACKNVELACRFLDYGYTEEGIITWNYGKEGESFEYVNGKPQLLPIITQAEEGISRAASRYTSMTASGISFMDLEFNRQRNLEFSNRMTDVCTANAEEAINHRMPAITVTEAESRELADIGTAINTYIDEMYIGFIIGTEDLNNYDKYVANLEAMGLKRVLEIKQAQLDRYNAR